MRWFNNNLLWTQGVTFWSMEVAVVSVNSTLFFSCYCILLCMSHLFYKAWVLFLGFLVSIDALKIPPSGFAWMDHTSVCDISLSCSVFPEEFIHPWKSSSTNHNWLMSHCFFLLINQSVNQTHAQLLILWTVLLFRSTKVSWDEPALSCMLLFLGGFCCRDRLMIRLCVLAAVTHMTCRKKTLLDIHSALKCVLGVNSGTNW